MAAPLSAFYFGLAMDFDARICGIPDYCNLVRSQLGRDEARYQVRKMRAARDEIVRLLGQPRRKEVTNLFRKKSQATSHLYLERPSLLQPLSEWLVRRMAEAPPKTSAAPQTATRIQTSSDADLVSARSISSSSSVLQSVQASTTSSSSTIRSLPVQIGFRTLEALGLNDALIVPLHLPKPLLLAMPDRAYRLPVVSAYTLQEELATLEGRLATAKAFGVPQVAGFMYARASDVKRLARLEGLTDRFWVRFAAVVLRHLAEGAIANGLCAHISDRPIAPTLG